MKARPYLTKHIISFILWSVSGCLFINQAQAQRRKTSIVKLGTGISFFSNQANGSSVPRVGISIGLAPTIPLSPKLYLKPEIAFSMKGGRIDYNAATIFSGNVRYQINYLDLPLVAGLRLTPWLVVEGGAYGAVKLGGSFDFQGTFAVGYGAFDRHDLHGFDYGPIGGLVLQSRLLQLGIRYYHGLTEIAAEEKARVLLGNASNNTIQLCIQLKRFRRKKN